MASGDIYDGEWREDQAHGMGVKIFNTGDVHSGMYRYDVREGHGLYQFANGDEYAGEWERGTQSGWGLFRSSNNNSAVFEGRWQNGKRHGPGYRRTMGGRYLEIWKRGTRECSLRVSEGGAPPAKHLWEMTKSYWETNDDDDNDDDESHDWNWYAARCGLAVDPS